MTREVLCMTIYCGAPFGCRYHVPVLPFVTSDGRRFSHVAVSGSIVGLRSRSGIFAY